MSETLSFPRRYQGCAHGALGGYAAGMVARRIDGPAEVNLGAPAGGGSGVAPPLPERLAALPARHLPGNLTLLEAGTLRSRLLGLARLDQIPPGHALRIDPCRSVHTFGMRFPLDLVFLDKRGEVARIAEAVRPRRLVTCLRARSVVEARAGEGTRFAEALRGHAVGEGS
jgi:uncharacterized membrane protein (UPF0127 family)